MVGTHSDIITFSIADHSNLSVGGEWNAANFKFST